MNRINVTWKAFLCCSILLLLTASSLQGADKPPKSETSPLPFTRVENYLRERNTATTIQNNKTEKALIGKRYSGIVSVWDVVEEDNDIIIRAQEESSGGNGDLRFRLQDSKLKKVAEQIRKNDRVLITATLAQFISRSSGYINVSDSYWAEFKNVQVLEVKSQEQSESKK